MTDTPTVDSDVVIEFQRSPYVRYRRLSTGETWVVRGVCDQRGYCLIGAIIDGETVETIERARELAEAYTGPDVPVDHGFESDGCCPLVVSDT